MTRNPDSAVLPCPADNAAPAAIPQTPDAAGAATSIPADTQRYPFGCPDPEWCRGNRCCYWECTAEPDEDL